MEGALLAGRLVLAAVLLAAASAKLVDFAGTRAALDDFGLPRRLTPAAALGLPLAELALAVALVPVATAAWAALAAAALLAAFSAAVARVLASGEEVECNCFGQLRSRPVGRWTLFRNLALLALALFVAAAGWNDAGTSATSWIADLTTGEAVAIGISAALAILVAANAFFSFQLLRQNGRLWAELEELRERLDGRGSRAKVGQPAAAVVVGRLAERAAASARARARPARPAPPPAPRGSAALAPTSAVRAAGRPPAASSRSAAPAVDDIGL